MKKCLLLLCAVSFLLGLAACGGEVDKTAVAETYSKVNKELQEVFRLAKDNIDRVDQGTVEELSNLGNTIVALAEEIESDKLTQERADEIQAELASYSAKAAELKSKVEALIESGVGLSEEQTAALEEIQAGLAEVYGKYAEVFDNLDDETKAFVNTIAEMAEEIGSVLDGTMELVADQAEQYIDGARGVLDAALQGWTQIEAQLNQ